MICPDLTNLIKYQAKAQELQKLKKHANPISLSGNLLSKIKGQGLDFLQLRKYYPGDEIKNIDWKVTARTGQTQVKEFQIDKSSQFSIIANVGADMQFASFGRFKYLISCDLIALLCFAASNNKENLHRYFYGNNLKKIARFKQRNYNHIEILKFLSTKRSLTTINKSNNLLATLQEFNSYNKESGVAFIICDFNSLITNNNKISQDIQFEIKRLSRKNYLYLCHIYDNAETSLAGLNLGAMNFSNYDQEEFMIDSNNTEFIKEYAANHQIKLNTLNNLTKDSKIKLVNISTDEDPLVKIASGL
jgi:hypothetical protein